MAACIILGWSLHGCRFQRLDKMAKLGLYCILAFLGIAFLSATQTIDSRYTDFYMGNMWKIVLMAVIALALLDTPQKIWLALLAVGFAQGYSAFRINEEYFQDGFCRYAFRDWGYKGDNNLYSNLTIPLLAAVMSISVYADKNAKLRFFAGTVAVLQIHQIMLLQSRGAMLGGIVMLLLFAWWMPKNRFTIRGSIAAGIAIIALAGPSVVDEFSSSFETEDNRDSSASSRIHLWKAGWAITWDNPGLGVGPYAGQVMVPKYYQGEGLPAGIYAKGLHNLPLEISTGVGVPGAVAYLLFYLIPIYCCWKIHKQHSSIPPTVRAVALAILSGIPGYLTGSFFSSGALLEEPYLLCVLGLAASSIMLRQPQFYSIPSINETGTFTPRSPSPV